MQLEMDDDWLQVAIYLSFFALEINFQNDTIISLILKYFINLKVTLINNIPINIKFQNRFRPNWQLTES